MFYLFLFCTATILTRVATAWPPLSCVTDPVEERDPRKHQGALPLSGVLRLGAPRRRRGRFEGPGQRGPRRPAAAVPDAAWSAHSEGVPGRSAQDYAAA
eukprot:9493519-Pyramimonas_sp.AAC.1